MRIIVAYSGRFQPFGPHHFASYQGLCNKFGANNVFIITTNKTGIDSPLNFSEKKSVIEKYGIPPNKIIQVKNPYSASELTSLFDPSQTSIVFAVGEKDKGRLSVTKADGSKGYFTQYTNNQTLPLSKTGYIYTLPNVRMDIPGIGLMSGTTLRKFIAKCTPQQFKQVFNWYDQGIFDILKKRIAELNEDITIPINIGDVILGGKFKNKKVLVKSIEKNEKGDITINGKPLLRFRILPKLTESLLIENGASSHINHPYNNYQLTFYDLRRIVIDLLRGGNSVTNITEKIDGQALAVTYKDGKFLAARNKESIKNPMTVQELESKFADIPNVGKSFISAFSFLKDKLGGLSDSLLNKFFKNGSVFLHIEIVNPENKNVIDYGIPYIIFLNMSEYDSNGELLREMPYTSKLLVMVQTDDESEFNIKSLPEIKLSNNSKLIPEFDRKIRSECEIFDLSDSATIGKFLENAINKQLPIMNKLSEQAKNGLYGRWLYKDKSIKLTNPMYSEYYEILKHNEDTTIPSIIKTYINKLEMIFLELGTEIIPTIKNTLVGKSTNSSEISNSIKDAIKNSVDNIQQNGNAKQIESLKLQWNKIKSLGGIDKVYPCEGIVFTYKNNQYKLTGIFAPVNQLLGILKYNS